jgi:hypothetical protein
MGGGGVSAEAEPAVAVPAVAAGPAALAAGCGIRAALEGEGLKRHARKATTAIAVHATLDAANILIRVEFFQNPRMLRGTSNS